MDYKKNKSSGEPGQREPRRETSRGRRTQGGMSDRGAPADPDAVPEVRSHHSGGESNRRIRRRTSKPILIDTPSGPMDHANAFSKVAVKMARRRNSTKSLKSTGKARTGSGDPEENKSGVLMMKKDNEYHIVVSSASRSNAPSRVSRSSSRTSVGRRGDKSDDSDWDGILLKRKNSRSQIQLERDGKAIEAGVAKERHSERMNHSAAQVLGLNEAGTAKENNSTALNQSDVRGFGQASLQSIVSGKNDCVDTASTMPNDSGMTLKKFREENIILRSENKQMQHSIKELQEQVKQLMLHLPRTN